MKKTILFPLLILSAIQLISAQKISLTYKVKTTDSLYVFKDKAFSEKKIQTKTDRIFLKDIPNKNIIYIEDNVNRRFDKTIVNNITYYSKLLNEGYFNLYELEVNNKLTYLVYSKSDTLVLEKSDSLVNQTIQKDTKYNGKLTLLCKDYPDLWEKAGKINFVKDDLQNLISDLNDKYPDKSIRKQDKSRFDFWGMSLKGRLQENKTDIMFDVLMSHYFLNISPNISFRYGFRANYFQQTEFFPKLFSGIVYYDPDGVSHQIYVYDDHYETMRVKFFELPISVNFEVTNSMIAPFCYVGLSPALGFRKITRTDSNEIYDFRMSNLNVFSAVGVKLKLTNNFNVISEYKIDLNKGGILGFGVEYYLKL